MNTPRECTEDCTAMSKASLGRTSPYLFAWETPTGSPSVEIWPSVPTVICPPGAEASKSSLRPNSSTATLKGSKRSFAMSLPMPSSSILEKMRYGAWLDGMARHCQKDQNGGPTASRKSFWENPYTTTRFSSKPSPEGPDHGPDTWGSEETT